MFGSLYLWLKQNLLDESENWFLWIPVFLGIGIVSYFKLTYEPSPKTIIYCFVFLSCTFLFAKKHSSTNVIWLICTTILIGFALISVKAHLLYFEKFPYEKKFFRVTATIDTIQPLEKGTRILFRNITFNNTHINQIPPKIRVIFKTNLNSAECGDTVEFSAILSPPALPLIPGGYDFSRHAYFEQIGAFGYAVSDIKILEKSQETLLKTKSLKRIRFNIQQTILKNTANSIGGIITALMVGEYASLDGKIIENLRISGLAHVLSVSGLHLSLIASIIFFCTRLLLNLNNYVALEFNVKKISAIFAILGSFIYLMLTGAYIAAIRAFIMTSIVLLAIIFDRLQLGIRSIAIAAIVILVIFPEYLVHPSFQMSFSAVLALISIYEILVKHGFTVGSYNLFYRIIFYFISISVSSLIAGIAISPFIAYHFNQFSQFSILANILVLPVVSFYIMPLIVLCFFLYPFGLLEYVLQYLSYGIEYFIMISNFVANLPSSYSMVAQMSDLSLGFIISGGLWLLLWQKNWRYFGLIPALIGLILIFTTTQPDLIIDRDTKNLIMKDYEGNIVFADRVRSRIKKETFSRYYGRKNANHLQRYSGNNIDFSCSNQKCIFKKNEKKVLIDYEHYPSFSSCYNEFDLIFVPNATIKDGLCKKFNIISNENLKKYGSHVIYLHDKLKVERLVDNLGFRLWNTKN